MENCRGKNGYGKSKKGCWKKMRTFSLFLLRSSFGLDLGMRPIPIWHARPVKIFSLFSAWGGREAVVSSPFFPPCIHIIKLPSHQTTGGKRGERLHWRFFFSRTVTDSRTKGSSPSSPLLDLNKKCIHMRCGGMEESGRRRAWLLIPGVLFWQMALLASPFLHLYWNSRSLCGFFALINSSRTGRGAVYSSILHKVPVNRAAGRVFICKRGTEGGLRRRMKYTLSPLSR